MTKICSKCGTLQNDEFNFCKNCGNSLSEKNTDVNVSLDDEIGISHNSDDEKISHESGSEGEKSSSPDGDDFTTCRYCGCKLNNETFCPDCGKATGIKICPQCRQKIVNEDFCSVCGYRINKNVKNCINCGKKIDAQAKVCYHCGGRVANKNPFVALVLSLIFPGLGQLYNNQNRKAIVLIIAYLVSLILCLILIGAVLALLVWIYGMYDAFTSAKAINRGESLEDRIFLI